MNSRQVERRWQFEYRFRALRATYPGEKRAALRKIARKQAKADWRRERGLVG